METVEVLFVVFAAVFATDLDVTFVVVDFVVCVVVDFVVCVVVVVTGVADAGAAGSRVKVSTDGVFCTGIAGMDAPFAGKAES